MKKERFNSKWVGLVSLAISLAFFADLSAQQPFGPLPGEVAPDGAAPSGSSRTPTVQDDGELVRPNEEGLPTSPFMAVQDLDDSDEQILLNTKYAGWQEGSEDGKVVQDVLRGNWIMVNDNGRFDGFVTAAEGADVSNMNVYLLHMGRMVKQTSLDSAGGFVFNNVRPGGYSLVGWGTKGFFAFGVNILSYNPDATATVQQSVNVTAFQNYTTINTDWIQYYAPGVHFRVFGIYQAEEEATDPPALLGTKGLAQNHPASIPATSISSHTVSKTEDGRLIGRVHQFNSLHGRPVDIRSTKVMLFEGDSVVAATTTDNYGVFEFLEVPDGSYGLLAAGADGVGLIAINVGSDDFSADGLPGGDSHVIDFTMTSSETIGWLNHYAVEVAYRRSLLAPRAKPNNSPNYCPQCGNRAGGCGACQGLANYYYCRSRGVSFSEWARKCNCPTQRPVPYGSETWGDHPNGAEPYGSQFPGAQPPPYYGTR